MSRRGENIFKRKDGRWEGRFFKEAPPGEVKKYGFVYGKTYREAKEKVENAKREVMLEKERKLAASRSFGHYAEEWLGKSKPFMKESTLVRYQHLMALHILPEFGQTAIAEIQNSDIEQYRNSLLCDGRCGGGRLSPKYVADILSLVKMVQKYATLQNPGLSVEIHNVSVKKRQAPLKVFTEYEQKVLYDSLCESDSYIHLGILIALFTGMRIGEICALKWEDVDLNDKVISVKHTMLRVDAEEGKKKTKIIVTSPKSACSIRIIPIPTAIYRQLRNAAKDGDAFVLTGTPDAFVEPRTLQNHFRKVLGECGIPYARFHTLRHTFATRCIELGFDVKTLSEILGHCDVKVTLNRYVHPSMSQKKLSMDRFSEAFAVE